MVVLSFEEWNKQKDKTGQSTTATTAKKNAYPSSVKLPSFQEWKGIDTQKKTKEDVGLTVKDKNIFTSKGLTPNKEGVASGLAEGFEEGTLSGVAGVESAIGFGAKKLGYKAVAEKYAQKAKDDTERLEYIQQERGDKKSVSRTVGAALPALFITTGATVAAPIIGTAAATAAGVGTIGTMALGTAYQKAKDAGADEATATKAALGTGLIEASLELIPFRGLLKFLPKKAATAATKEITRSFGEKIISGLKSFGKQGLLEAPVEAIQQVNQNAWEQTYNENKKIFDQVPESALFGFLLGGSQGALINGYFDLFNKLGKKGNSIEKEAAYNATNAMQGLVQEYVADKSKVVQQYTSPNGSSGEISVITFEDGKAAVSAKVTDASGNQFDLPYTNGQIYDSEESAIDTAKTQINAWATKQGVEIPKFENVTTDTKPLISSNQKPIDTNEPLINEARKYKSAEEFIKAQGQTVYRTGDVSTLRNDDTFGKVRFFADRLEMAKMYGGTVNEAVVNVKKPFVIKELTPDDPGIVNVVESFGGTKKFREMLKKEGYDGIRVEKNYGNEIIALDASQIKTKSQLTDIYNKAVGTDTNVPTSTPEKQDNSEIVVTSTEEGRTEAINNPVDAQETQGKKGGQKSKRYQNLVKKLNEEQRASIGRDDPTYNRVNMADDATRAYDFVEQNEKVAQEVAEGRQLPPEGILREHIASALMGKYLEQGNIDAWSKLAVSQSLRGTRYGQEIASFRGTNDPANPEYWIKQILKWRMERSTRYNFETQDGVDNAQKVIKKRIDSNARAARERLTKDRIKIEEANELLTSLICK